jgi:hypothetical protein
MNQELLTLACQIAYHSIVYIFISKVFDQIKRDPNTRLEFWSALIVVCLEGIFMIQTYYDYSVSKAVLLIAYVNVKETIQIIVMSIILAIIFLNL